MDEENLKNGFIQAKKITKRFAKTFYLASLLLPKDKRLASYAIYAICRISDESVDNPACSSQLEQIKENIALAYASNKPDSDLMIAFIKVIKEYNIPKEYFLELLEGMQMDLMKNRYQNFSELYDYCYKAAGVVGLIMLKIFGYRSDDARKQAINLGIAMQLTNILRDINEDFQRGRIYLSVDEMRQFKVTENSIAGKNIDNNFREFMAFQIKRAREYYLESEKGIKMIPSLRCRLVVLAMKDMYSGILKEIEKNGYDVFGKRASVNTFKKIGIIIRIIIKGKYICA